MRKLFVTFAALTAVLIAGTSLSVRAQAAPMNAGLARAIDHDDGLLQLVAQGCGPGFYRGPYGRCRPMAGGAVVVTPPIAPVCVRRCGPLGCRTVCR